MDGKGKPYCRKEIDSFHVKVSALRSARWEHVRELIDSKWHSFSHDCERFRRMCTHAPRLHTCPTYIRLLITWRRSPSIQACLSRAYTSVALNHMHRMSVRRYSVRTCNANKIHPSSHIQISSHAQASHSRVISLGIKITEMLYKTYSCKITFHRVIYRDKSDWSTLIGSVSYQILKTNRPKQNWNNRNKIKKNAWKCYIWLFEETEITLPKIKLYFYVFNTIPTTFYS